MKDFEANAEPLQDCLNATELAVQESSTRLHDLTAKKLELHKLQVQRNTEITFQFQQTQPPCQSAAAICKGHSISIPALFLNV